MIAPKGQKENHTTHGEHRDDHNPGQGDDRLAPLGNNKSDHQNDKNSVCERYDRPDVREAKCAAAQKHTTISFGVEYKFKTNFVF